MKCVIGTREKPKKRKKYKKRKKVIKKIVKPKERYDYNGNNITKTPINWETDLVPIQLWKYQSDLLAKRKIKNTNLRRKMVELLKENEQLKKRNR